VVVVIGCAAPARADEVRLKRGDRLTGTVVKLDAGTLTLETGFGDLAVPWPEVAAITTTTPLLVTVTGRIPVLATLGTPGEGQVTVVSSDRTEAMPLSELTAIAAPEPPFTINGGANLGLLTTGGNTDVNSLRIDGELILRARANRFTSGLAINRAEDRGRTTAENATLSLRFDRFVTTRVFLSSDAILTTDRFRGLDLRTALGLGVGYQIWNTPRASLSIDGGLGYVDEHFASARDTRYAAAREQTKLEVAIAGNRARAFHRHDGYFGLHGDDNLFVRTSNGVRLSLMGGLVSTVALDVDYDRSPEPGRRKMDRTLSITFGYRY
jgi:putative salt-induced outer membrane protein YdiY